jgi:hypothetical protein
VRDELLFVIQALLASSQPLPPLAHVCHARGLSTGFARYRLPIEVKEFLKRRRRERSAARLIRRSEATQVANEALRASEGVGNLKRTEESSVSKQVFPSICFYQLHGLLTRRASSICPECLCRCQNVLTLSYQNVTSLAATLVIHWRPLLRYSMADTSDSCAAFDITRSKNIIILIATDCNPNFVHDSIDDDQT